MSLAAVRVCVVIHSGLAGMSEMVLGCTTRTVVSHWETWCVWRNRVDLENREKQREASDRLPSPGG